jgi:predicted DsbA family dithiol-disulfide isomerase
MQVEVWSDVVCPWCYIGKRRLEAALAAFPHRDEIDVLWRSFELNPNAPARVPGDPAERLAAKYGMTVEWARAANARVTSVAAGEGLRYRVDMSKPGNTFDAHRLLHLARDQGRQGQAKERLMAAYFTEGEAIGERDTLVRLMSEVGLEPDGVRSVLAGDAYSAEVRSDEREAAELGIGGVPFFVIDRRYGISGAQPAELIQQGLEQAWREARPIKMFTQAGPGPVATCDEDGCPV